MLVSGESWDLNWFLQFIFSAFLLVLGLHTLLKNTASKYFEVDANFDAPMPPTLPMDDPICAVCGKRATKKCSRCKAVRYCSQVCQQSHWKSGHKFKCKDFDHTHSSAVNSTQNEITNPGFKASATGNKTSSSVALIPGGGTSRLIKQQPKDFLFPYDEFIKFFNWDKPRFRPCGLLNCGNSCFANVVLQCLSFTRPLVAYLLEKDHRRECSRNDWCFLCEFETHVEKTRLSTQAFSPVNILSRLPNIGGTLGYGRQEDAHEFMRFSIDNMQSVCLDEFGGEKVIPPNLQETTLIQHIFGGNLQSKVNCTKCDKISNQYEHMMDLTVEIHGDAASLEECLDQFTVKEWLQGENMYKCDGCNDYVKASKRLTVKRAPNILTIALKRFQNGIFGKLNKRVAFPETLDLSPYMSDVGDGSDVYKLYAVVVHIDMLNASFFGHYICYIKDFHGNWYRIDDWKVMSVELEEVLSQGAYMLLYSRTRAIVRTLAQPFNMHNQEKIKFWVSARSSGLQTTESQGIAEVQTVKVEGEPGPTEQPECLCNMETVTCRRGCEVLPSDRSLDLKVLTMNAKSTGMSSDAKIEHSEDMDMIDVESTSDVANEISCSAVESSYIPISPAAKDLGDVDMGRSLEETSGCKEEQDDTDMAKSGPSSGLPNGFSFFNEDSIVSVDYQNVREDSEHIDVVKCKSSTAKVNANYSSGFASANESAIPVEDDGTSFSGVGSFPTETDEGNGITKVKLSGDKLIM